MKAITEPTTLTPDDVIFTLSIEYGQTVRHYMVGKREFLNIEKLTRKALKEEYNGSGHAVTDIGFDLSMDGPNSATLTTMDHHIEDEEPTIFDEEDLTSLVESGSVVWDSADFYYNLH